jgi:hypothetical protein
MNRKHNTGKDYEEMVLFVYRVLCGDSSFRDVRHNVKLDGPDGERQIDVLVIHDYANVRYTTIIECKDYRGKLNVTHVDAFASKLVDVKASKGILVSRNGFSKTACQKAKRLGIELCMIDTAESLLQSLIIEVPVVLSIISSIELKIHVFFGNNTDQPIPIYTKDLTVINDKPLRDLLIEELKSGVLPIPSKTCEIEWEPSSIDHPMFIRDGNMNLLQIEWFKTIVLIEIDFYVGKASEFPDFITHLQQDDKNIRFIIPPEFRLGLKDKPVHYKDKADVPLCGCDAVPCLILPEYSEKRSSTGKVIFFTPKNV